MEHGSHATEHSIFVGDLGPEIDDNFLMQFFQSYYSSVRSVKIIYDTATGRSKGFGFVRFTNEGERDRALNEMSGVFIGSRAIRCRLATAKQSQGGDRDRDRDRDRHDRGAGSYSSASTLSGPDDPNNTTLFVGGLSSSVTEDQLRHAFAPFGEICYSKIPPGKGCGFVQYVERRCAEYALKEMNGTMLGGSALRVAWGQSQAMRGARHAAAASNTYTPGGGSGYPAGATQYPSYGGVHGGPAPYGAAAPGYGYDPYTGVYGMPYGAGDPYGGYGGYGGMDAYGYPHTAHPGYGAAPAAAFGTGPGQSGSGVPTIYDPLTLVSVDKLNSAYMHRVMPSLTGSFMKVKA